MLLEFDLVVRPMVGKCRPHPAICSWGVLWERDAVVVFGNASRGPSQLAVALMGLELPPLCDNLPVVRWPPLELRDNQPPVDRPPLEVVLPPLEGGLSVVLSVLLALCCVVPLLLRPHFLPPRF